jgi:hypothetical protein
MIPQIDRYCAGEKTWEARTVFVTKQMNRTVFSTSGDRSKEQNNAKTNPLV